MLYDEYREWLRARGASAISVNVNSSALRMIERELATLGSPFDDLDEAYDADSFAQLIQAFDGLREDARAGGERFRALFPKTANPVARIAQTKNLLRQYSQFRAGATPNLAVVLDPGATFWFVGASFGRTSDQVERFLQEGIWEIDQPKTLEADLVRSMQVGDRIAIKAAFVQRHDLPFDNRDQSVSVMRIKARGTITGNPGDGERVEVEWDTDFDVRDWYFYTYRPTIWKLRAGQELSDQLIAFTFYDEPQDIDWFRNHGTWALRHGDQVSGAVQRFWIEKTLCTGRPDRESGEHALGHALWSPQRSKDGKNIYASMLQVAPGDVVFHLTDNQAISAVSIASDAAQDDFVGLEGSDWAGQPAYRVELSEHEKLEPPLPRDAFLETEPFATELRELAESGAKGLFYNSRRGLNQGAYLTEATPTLLSILNRAYQAFAGKGLPHVALDADGEAVTMAARYTLDDALADLFLERSTAEEILLLWEAKKNIILCSPSAPMAQI